MKRHVMDYKNMVCSCGKTKEQHLMIDLKNTEIKMRWELGDVNITRDFAELTNVYTT